MGKIIPITTKNTPKRHWRKSSLVIAAIVLGIAIFLVVTLVSFINYLRVDMVRANLGTIDTSFECQLVVVRNESVIYAPDYGQFVSTVEAGQKVKAGGIIGYMSADTDSNINAGSTAVTTELGGLVFYDLDGWEEVLTPDNLLSVDWQEIFAKMSADDSASDTAEEDVAPANLGNGRKVARIVDNLSDIYVCLSVEEDITAYINSDTIGLRFADLSYTLKGYVNEPEALTSNDRYIIVRIGVEEPLLNELRYGQVEVIGQTVSGVEIPKSAITTNEEGQTGVYVKDKKKLAFCEVEVLGEGEETVIVEGINATDMVASNPGPAKVGQKVY